MDGRCSFFQWADEGSGDHTRGGGRGGGASYRGRGGKKQNSQFRAKPYDSDEAPKQGLCATIYVITLV